MKNILYESHLIKILSDDYMPYLNEYLILSNGISLDEGKIIIKEAADEAKSKVNSAWKAYKDKLAILDKLENRELKNITDPKKIAEKKSKFNTLRKNAYAIYLVTKKRILNNFTSAKTSVKNAIYKNGKSGKGLSPIGKFKNLTKKGKAGVIGTVALAGFGGYAAYRAKKNRDKYLPDKEIVKNAKQSVE